MIVQGIIFDLDGTLVDTRLDLATAINLMRADYQLQPLPLDTVTAFVGDGARNLVGRALEGTPVDVDDALPRFKRHYAAHLLDTTACYPGVQAMLEACAAAAIRCAVITNKPEAPTRKILEHMAILNFFNPVIGGDTTPHLKPDPFAVRLVLDRWNLGADDVVVIGDHDTDITVAHNAGLKAVFLTCGFGRRRAEQPDYIAGSMAEAASLMGII